MLKTTSVEDRCFGSKRLGRHNVGGLPDCLDSLIACLRTLLAPAQFFATKSAEEAQTRPAEFFEEKSQELPQPRGSRAQR